MTHNLLEADLIFIEIKKKFFFHVPEEMSIVKYFFLNFRNLIDEMYSEFHADNKYQYHII